VTVTARLPSPVTKVDDLNSSEFGFEDTNNLPGHFTLDIDGLNMENGEAGDYKYTISDGEDETIVTGGQVHYDTSGAIDGGSTDDIIIGSSGTQTLNGNGGNDILVGGGGDDQYNGGTGTDTVVFRDDVTSIGNNFQDGDFDSIEIIDLGVGYDSVQLGNSGAGGGNRLNADDVLNITDSAATPLFIKGDANDDLFIDNAGGNGLTVSATQDQAGYVHYTGTSGGNTVHLYVDQDIDVNAGNS
jgi:Ca2+-binding RTX toxin-like protein